MNEKPIQPAEVTDEQIIAIKKATKAADPTQQWGDTLAFARAILALRQEQAQHPKCKCGDRPVNQCDEEWGPNCDLGNNEKFVRVTQQPKPQPAEVPAPSLWEQLHSAQPASQLHKRLDEIDLGPIKAKLKDPEKAKAFLRKAGILNERNELAEAFCG